MFSLITKLTFPLSAYLHVFVFFPAGLNTVIRISEELRKVKGGVTGLCREYTIRMVIETRRELFPCLTLFSRVNEYY